jgi:hypothetical protein
MPSTGPALASVQLADKPHSNQHWSFQNQINKKFTCFDHFPQTLRFALRNKRMALSFKARRPLLLFRFSFSAAA